MNRRTAFSSLDRAGIPCSAEKNEGVVFLWSIGVLCGYANNTTNCNTSSKRRHDVWVFCIQLYLALNGISDSIMLQLNANVNMAALACVCMFCAVFFLVSNATLGGHRTELNWALPQLSQNVRPNLGPQKVEITSRFWPTLCNFRIFARPVNVTRVCSMYRTW